MRGRGARARAGIQAVKLEELERRLRNDIVHEALAWGGRVLLHREVPRSQAFSPLASPTAAGAGAATPGAARGSGAGAGGVGDSERAWSVDDAGLGPGVAEAGAADSEDVTRQQEDECVAAFWEPTGAPRALRLAARSAAVCTRAATRAQPCCAAQVAMGDIDAGLATPLEVWQGLAAEGFNVAYRRLPLSRERTPEAADLDVLHRQLLTQPDGARPEQPRTLP